MHHRTAVEVENLDDRSEEGIESRLDLGLVKGPGKWLESNLEVVHPGIVDEILDLGDDHWKGLGKSLVLEPVKDLDLGAERGPGKDAENDLEQSLGLGKDLWKGLESDLLAKDLEMGLEKAHLGIAAEIENLPDGHQNLADSVADDLDSSCRPHRGVPEVQEEQFAATHRFLLVAPQNDLVYVQVVCHGTCHQIFYPQF